MAKNYIVYFLERKLVLSDNQPLPGTDFTQITSVNDFVNIVNDFEKNQNICYLHLYTDDIELMWKTFSSKYRLIEAAGGLVRSDTGKWLFIKRLGRWDLPKGKIEKGERPEVAAIREVEEETMLYKPVIREIICETFHTYSLDGKAILKKTYWYLMDAKEKDDLVPQTSESIVEVRWVNDNELSDIIKNTYPSIIEVLTKNGLL